MGKRIKGLCKYIKIACIGNRIRRRLFMEKLLAKANRCWFAYPDDVYKKMCNELSSQFINDHLSVDEFFVRHFDFFQRRSNARMKQRESVSCIYINALSVKALNAFEYQVELLRENTNYKKGDSDSEEFKVALSYEVKISFKEIEENLWK
jgi:hypothetical protein